MFQIQSSSRAAPVESAFTDGVAFAPGFSERVGRFAARERARRRRPEPADAPGGSRVVSARPSAAGYEFVGHRPYRAGHDPRDLDWALLARDAGAFVRAFAPERDARARVVVDTSASMGVGVPSKLQRACELAALLGAALALSGTRVALSASADPRRGLELRPQVFLRPALTWLAARRAAGERGLAEVLAQGGAPATRGARTFLLGDPWDVAPAALARCVAAARGTTFVALVARDELRAPGARGRSAAAPSVRWRDPESGALRDERLDAERRAAYDAAVGRRLAALADACAAHGGRLLVPAAGAQLEEIARAALGGPA